MALTTIPLFYYIDPITSDNNKLDFDEGSTDYVATLNVGSRAVTDLMNEVARAMNASVGPALTYTVTFDRDTRKVTISSTSTFSLLITSGTNSAISVFTLLGFNGADLTGSSSYTGDTAIGSAYSPQFKVQKYIAFDDWKEKSEAKVNKSGSGKVEVVSFGDVQFMQFELKYITDNTKSKSNPITNNSSAVSEARSFLDFLISKQDLEFMPDKSDTATYDTVLLERSQASGSGTGYRLKEMTNRGLNDHYETGVLRFRKVS